ncbi:3-oxo-tetronate kinase [Noviherbaspirillum sedimenti]|uniref:3-oxo-tetronate kinase n=1 Tax=Noviherbaspirillum sedimenti TaxID=2320865 RepID=A0A3A3G7L4_9BURK|nr:3-oxo-tetronate kinase [Noviherbaspirillum sedimenti]RJG03625.1 four-carbon acid sugar kinase family protein [Noviherbaspirillum sedimenti]
MTVLLGCIADDFTGGTDLAGMLVKAGMRTVQLIGVPTEPIADDVDAVVIALKSRTSPVDQAVSESLAALRWLQSAGCKQIYFKYCSTFDSTPRGNIGPVTEALMTALGAEFTIACPAFPANGRTIYKGYLFVGEMLLSESGMRNHPLTPMTDSNLVRVMQQQTERKVGLVDSAVVDQGAAAIGERIAGLRERGYGLAIVDALSDVHLESIGAACADMPLITGGSGIALGLPENFRRRGLLSRTVAADVLAATGGLRAVISGSCSVATQRQVALMRASFPAFKIDPLLLARGEDLVSAALDWAGGRIGKQPVLIYATATPETVKQAQLELGAEQAGGLVENALAEIAKGLVRLGVGQMIVAGGETSGAVVNALGIKGLRIGPEIDPGVPWTTTLPHDASVQPLALALKSGNFGSEDFFLKAWDKLQ